MQTLDNTQMCYRRENRKTRRKTFPPPSKRQIDPLENKLEYTNNKRPSKPSLPHVFEPSMLLLPTDLTKFCLLQPSGSRNSAQLHPPNKWLLPMLPSSTKTSLYTQDGCGKCLGYQPFKNLEMERQELRKTTINCVENCGYDNILLSRVMARVFSLKSTSQHMWVMWVYIVWIETWCIRYDKLAKQNVLRVSRKKALPARHSRKLAVTICHDSSHASHVLSTCFTSQEGFSRATRENFFGLQFALSLHTLSHTQPLQ